MKDEEIRQEKNRLRREIKERIKRLSPEYCKEADRQILEQVMKLEAYRQAETVFLFVGSFGEPDTTPLIQRALDEGKRVCVPKCLDECQMKAFEIQGMEQLRQGRYGILEPADICPEIDRAEIDFALIPCVTCDEKGNRLGHGKGYYDRYMEGANFISCMVCRRNLTVKEVPTTIYDIRPDIWITDEVGHVT